VGQVINMDKMRVDQLPAILKKQNGVIVGDSPTSKDLLRESAREFDRFFRLCSIVVCRWRRFTDSIQR